MNRGPAVYEVDQAIEGADRYFEAFAADEWELEPIVAQLGTDPQAAFSSVRDSIAFQPYPGVLRGPAGTLACRAGNALDRAMLLKALLEAQGYAARFARADLDGTVSQGLIERALLPVAKPLQTASDLILDDGVRQSIEYVVSLLQDVAAPMGLALDIDLMLDGVDVIASADAPAMNRTHLGMWYGALQSALETETGIRIAPAFGADVGSVDSVSLRHDTERAELVRPSDIATLPTDAPAAMRRALSEGQAIVLVDARVPEAW